MMLDLSLGYQVLVQPAILVVALAYAVWQISKGFTRVESSVDNVKIKTMEWQGQGRIARAVIGLGLGVLLVLSTVVVPFGHRGVIWTTGGVNYTERQPGLSFIVPILQSDRIMDVRQQRFATVYGPEDGKDLEGKANGFIQTSDLQEVTIKASLIYKIVPDQAAEVLDSIGSQTEIENIIDPIFFDAVKEAAGKCIPDAEGTCTRTALSFARQLSDVATDIEDIVGPELAPRGIEVLQVAVEDAVFDPDFIKSVKNKVIATQNAEEQQNLIAAHEAQKQQAIIDAQAVKQQKLIEAEGEQEAIQSVAAALGFTPAEYLDWLRLQRWNGVLPTTVVGDQGGVGIFLNVGDSAASGEAQ